jgi:hypothetical protein
MHPRLVHIIAFILMRGIFAFLRMGARGRITLIESGSNLNAYERCFRKLLGIIDFLLSISYAAIPKSFASYSFSCFTLFRVLYSSEPP